MEPLKFNNKTDSTEDFVVKMKNLGLKAYLPPMNKHVEPLKEKVAYNQQIVEREERKNENRRILATMEKDRHVVRLFKKAMARFNRLKLLEEPENATKQDLHTKTKQKLISRELYPVDD